MIKLLPHAAAALALTFMLQPAQAERLPAKLFAQHEQYSAVALSPDGTHLAIATPVDNHTDLMIVDLTGKNEPGRLRSLPTEHVLGPFWASDNRLVFSKGKKTEPAAYGGKIKIAKVNVDENRRA